MNQIMAGSEKFQLSLEAGYPSHDWVQRSFLNIESLSSAGRGAAGEPQG